MIPVYVALYATLKKYRPEGVEEETFKVNLPQGSTIKDLLETLKIPEEESKQAFVNNRKQGWDYTFQGGERVAIFPPIAGG